MMKASDQSDLPGQRLFMRLPRLDSNQQPSVSEGHQQRLTYVDEQPLSPARTSKGGTHCQSVSSVQKREKDGILRGFGRIS